MSKARDLANAGTALTTVSATELGYLDGVTSAIQTQIDSKIGQATAINPTIVDAKGDIIAATAADTVSRLAVGSNDQVLTADSSTATGLKWATPTSGGMTLLSTTSVGTGTSITISSISQSYKSLYFVFREIKFTGSDTLYVRINGNSASASHAYVTISGASVSSASSIYGIAGANSSDLGILNGTMTIPDYSNTTLNSKPFTCDTTSININNSIGQRRITLNTSNGNSADSFVGTGAVTSVWFGLGGFNFTSGTILMYGVN